jgi:bacterioferritin-associated ferredoxin
MIVCSCNVFSDRDVRSAIDNAASRPATANQVYGCLGCSPQCGRCARTIRRIMDEALTTACAEGCAVACAHMQIVEERVEILTRRVETVER